MIIKLNWNDATSISPTPEQDRLVVHFKNASTWFVSKTTKKELHQDSLAIQR